MTFEKFRALSALGLLIFAAACAAGTQVTEEAEEAPAAEAAPSSGGGSSAPAGNYQQPAAQPAAPPPATPAAPQVTTVEVPAGTILEAETMRRLTTAKLMPGDKFRARTIYPVTIDGQEIIPIGSIVRGTVTDVKSATKMKGQASMTLEFHAIKLPDDTEVPVVALITSEGKEIGKRTAGIVGGSAAGGAVLGRIIGKDTKGAVAGAVVGAALGTGIAAAQDGQEVDLPKGTGIAIELAEPVRLEVKPQGA